jgi:hypothetical protein
METREQAQDTLIDAAEKYTAKYGTVIIFTVRQGKSDDAINLAKLDCYIIPQSLVTDVRIRIFLNILY